jgi:2-hydroxy-3-keto-5-methylthiopentenyl-1-phosphate phosphatase
MSQIGTFWSDAAKAPLIVLTDFDFTISQVDVGDLLVDTLSPPSAETVARCRSGEAGSKVWWWDSMAKCNLDEALALADTVDVDPHFPGFAAWAAEQSIPVAVVSDGFWFYVHHILGKAGLERLPVFCNEMPETGSLRFPHANAACDRCACCKAAVVRRAREGGTRVIYIGDGTSDVYASAFADWVFAKGHLAGHMQQQGSPYYPFDTFADVHRAVRGLLPAFMEGTAPRRVSLAPHVHCHFDPE